MGTHLNTTQRHYILREMLELARFLTGNSIPLPTVREAVKRLRDDLIILVRAGSKDITVDRQSYVPVTADQQEGEAS